MKVRPSRTSLYRLLLGTALMLLGWALASMTAAQADDGTLGKVLTTSTESVTATADAAATEVAEVVEGAAPSVNESTTKALGSDPVDVPTASTVKAVTTTVRSVEPTVAAVAEPVREATKRVAEPVREVTKTVAAPAIKVVEVTEPVVVAVKAALPLVSQPPTKTASPTALPTSLSLLGTPSVAMSPTMLERGGASATVYNRGGVVDRLMHSARIERAARAELASAPERLLGHVVGDRARALLAAMSESGAAADRTFASPVRALGAPGPSAPAPGQPTLGALSGAPGSVGSSGHGSTDNATAAVNADLVDPSSATPPLSGEMWMSAAPVQDPGSRPD